MKGFNFNFKSLISLLLCSLCWGPSFLFIKVGVTHIPPLTLAFWRVGIALIVLFGLCLLQKRNLSPWKPFWKELSVMGILVTGITAYLVAYGEMYISTAVASIVSGFGLVFTAIFAHFIPPRETLSRGQIFGVLLGIGGLVVMNFPFLLLNGHNGISGILLVLVGMVSLGLGSVYARPFLRRIPPLTALTFSLIGTTIVLGVLSLLFETSVYSSLPTLHGFLAVLAWGIIGTAGGFYFYYQTLKLSGPLFASFSIILSPIIAVAIGIFGLEEELAITTYFGGILILLGVFVMNASVTKWNKKNK